MSVPTAVTDLAFLKRKLDEETKKTPAAVLTTASNLIDKKRLRKRTKSNGESLIVLYIQMRLCDFTLRYWMNNRNSEYYTSTASVDVKFELDDSLAMNIFRQIVSGVEYIHSKSIIHRDLKVYIYHTLL